MDYSEVRARLRQLQSELGLSQKSIGDDLDMSSGGISAVFKGTGKITKALALAFEATYGYNSEWILEGKDPKKITTKKLSQLEQAVIEGFHNLFTDEQNRFLEDGFLTSLYKLVLDRRNIFRENEGITYDLIKKATDEPEKLTDEEKDKVLLFRNKESIETHHKEIFEEFILREFRRKHQFTKGPHEKDFQVLIANLYHKYIFQSSELDSSSGHKESIQGILNDAQNQIQKIFDVWS